MSAGVQSQIFPNWPIGLNSTSPTAFTLAKIFIESTESITHHHKQCLHLFFSWRFLPPHTKHTACTCVNYIVCMREDQIPPPCVAYSIASSPRRRRRLTSTMYRTKPRYYNLNFAITTPLSLSSVSLASRATALGVNARPRRRRGRAGEC